MMFRNSTDYPDRYLRRMLRWCIKEVGVPRSKIYRGFLRSARFTRSRHSYTGWAGGGTILVRIGPPELFPVDVAHCPKYRAAGMTELLLDRDACLVHITAHELAHIRLSRIGKAKNNEANAETIARGVSSAYIANREKLQAEWMAEQGEQHGTTDRGIQDVPAPSGPGTAAPAECL